MFDFEKVSQCDAIEWGWGRQEMTESILYICILYINIKYKRNITICVYILLLILLYALSNINKISTNLHNNKIIFLYIVIKNYLYIYTSVYWDVWIVMCLFRWSFVIIISVDN